MDFVEIVSGGKRAGGKHRRDDRASRNDAES
jgi:hypothetical protein